MTEPIILAEFQKNATEYVRIRLDRFRNVDTVDVRVFYQDSATGALSPTKKGVCMARDHFPDLVDAINEAAGKLCVADPEEGASDG